MLEDRSGRMLEYVKKNVDDMLESMSENMSNRMLEDGSHGSQGKCLWVMLHKTDNLL